MKKPWFVCVCVCVFLVGGVFICWCVFLSFVKCLIDNIEGLFFFFFRERKKEIIVERITSNRVAEREKEKEKERWGVLWRMKR